MTLGDRVVVMQDGVILQVGPPLEIYRRPVNRFVAGFIGAPAMNFIEGTVDAEGTSLKVSGDLRLLLPGPQAPRRRLALGIRPQHLQPVAVGSPASVPVTVRFSEPLGEETDLTLDGPGGIELLARLRLETQPPAGETMSLGFQPDMVHLFDQASGERVN